MTMPFTDLRDSRILVTGTTGFKGSWLGTWLADLGAKVVGFALPPEADAPLFQQLKLPDRIDQHYGDVRDKAAVDAVFAKARPDIVIHMAAQALVRKSYAEPKETFDVNIGGSVNILEAARATSSIRSLVFVTSDKCYRNKEWIWGYRENDELGGSDPYSASKACAELVFASYQDSFFAAGSSLVAAAARAGNVIGGGDFSADRIVPDCIRALSGNRAITLRNPNSVRPWQHVLEPLSGYLQLAQWLLSKPDIARGSWNFGPDAENVRTVEELASLAVRHWGSGEIKSEIVAGAPHEAGLLMIDAAKAKIRLGWRPRWNFDQAVANTVNWYRQVHDGADPLAVTRAQIADYSGR